MTLRSRFSLAAMAVAAGLCTSVPALAQPANDACATVVTGGFDIPPGGGTVMGTTVSATPDGETFCDAAEPSPDVYFRFTPSASGQWVFSLCTSAVIDTVISVHRGCPADTTTEIDCDDDSCGGGIGVLSTLTIELTAGTTYIVRIGMWESAAVTGPFTLTASGVTAPPNDECTGAVVAAIGATSGNSIGASTSTTLTPSNCPTGLAGSGGSNDVWFSFSPPATAPYSIDTCGSSFDTVLSVHSGCPGDDSNLLACNDDSTSAGNTPCTGNGLNSRIQSVALNAGTIYFIRVAGYGPTGGASGAIALNINNAGNSGACCGVITGACTFSASGAPGCSSGNTFQGAGTSCQPNACPQPPPPANDACASAIALCDGVAVSGATTTATNDGTATCGVSAISRDVWYSYNATVSGNVSISTCGSTMDTVLAAFDMCSGTQIVCLDDSCGLQTTITVSATAGTPFLIRVAGYNNGAGAFTITATGGAGTCGSAGVCCRGATCSTSVVQGACTGSGMAGARFVSTATVCNSGPLSSAPCCYADYNKQGGISVQDIFDFLGDWFASSPLANTGGTGAPTTLSVQNIFDFLSDWFAGGCQ